MYLREFIKYDKTALSGENILVGNRYRLSKSLVGVRESTQGQVLYTLQTDSVVSVNSFLEEGRSVQVDAEQVSLSLFTQDLIRFAELVEENASPNTLLSVP